MDGVFDLVGGPRFRLALRLARPGGVVVQAANPSLEDTLINVRDFYPKNLSILGFQYGNLMAIGKDRFADQLEIVLNGFTTGRFQPLERSVFSVDIAAQAHLRLQDRTHIGKVLIECLGGN
jgi:NADPH2:quinone reductase